MAVNVSNIQTIPRFIVSVKYQQMFKRNRKLSEAVEVWSKDTNLVFNPNKTKAMVISSKQMTEYHKLDISNKVNIKSNNKNIEKSRNTNYWV